MRGERALGGHGVWQLMCRMLYIPLAILGTGPDCRFLGGKASFVALLSSSRSIHSFYIIAHWNSPIFTPFPLPFSLASALIISNLQTRHPSVRSLRLNKSPFAQSTKSPFSSAYRGSKNHGQTKTYIFFTFFFFLFPFYFLFSHLRTFSVSPFLPPSVLIL